MKEKGTEGFLCLKRLSRRLEARKENIVEKINNYILDDKEILQKNKLSQSYLIHLDENHQIWIREIDGMPGPDYASYLANDFFAFQSVMVAESWADGKLCMKKIVVSLISMCTTSLYKGLQLL